MIEIATNEARKLGKPCGSGVPCGQEDERILV